MFSKNFSDASSSAGLPLTLDSGLASMQKLEIINTL
jgi:hypothetical protein